KSFLQQYIAYRRVDPSVCKAPLTLHDLLELALPSDYELVNTILENFERERAASDQRDFVRFCFNAPQRLTAAGRNVFHLIDCVQIAGQSEIMLGQEMAAVLTRSGGPFALAGLRRQIVDLIHGADNGNDAGEVVHLEKLSDDDARKLVEGVWRRAQIQNDEPESRRVESLR